MAFSAAQLTAFWTNAPQMNISAGQRIKLQDQGLSTIEDFRHFDEETLDIAFKNLKFSQSGIPAIPEVTDANGNVITAAVPAVPPIVATPIGAIQAYRIHTARLAYEYLTTVGRAVTPLLMNFTASLRDFRIEYDSIVKLSDQDEPDLPKISKELPIMPWQAAFENYCSSIFGVRKIPLQYVIRPNDDPPDVADDPLLPGCLYGETGSLLDDLIVRSSHDHPLFKSDNQKIYKLLTECTLGTQYASTVSTFARRKDGRAAYLALVTSHIGNDKWEKRVERMTDQIMNLKWNGRTYPLERYCNRHRTAHAALDEARAHVDVHEFNDTSKVKYLIENIENSDADLKAAIGMIRADHNGLKSDFEGAIRLLLPVDPFKPRGGKFGKDGKRTFGEVGSATAEGRSQHGTGKTGVELCFHTNAQYRKLTKEQKDELRQWRQTKEGKESVKRSKQKNSNATRKDRKTIREAADTMLDILKESSKPMENQESKHTNSAENTDDKKRKAYEANALKLQDILKRIKS